MTTPLIKIRHFVLVILFAQITHAAPPSVFTFQGQLMEAGIPVNDVTAFEFSLWDSVSEGRMVAESVRTELEVRNGLFSVELDFGPEAIRGEPRWLEINVRTRTGGAILSPRQPVTPTPVALFALDGNQGPRGPAGGNGLSCWDTNGDGVADPAEDVNNDGVYDSLDCQGNGGTGELTLPFSGTNTTNITAMSILQEGLFPAGIFNLQNVDAPFPALTVGSSGTVRSLLATNTGTGAAARFTIPYGTNESWTMTAQNDALGRAAYFTTSNDNNISPTIESWNAASGPAAYFKTARDAFAHNETQTLDVHNDSWGSAATFRNTNDTNISDVVKIINIGNANGNSMGNGLDVETNNIEHSIHSKNAGIGGAGWFQVTRYSNIAPAIYGIHEGRGCAAHFKTNNVGRDRPTVLVEMNDDEAGVQSEASGTGYALFGWSKGSGTAVRGLSEGTGGSAGWFSVNGATLSSPSLRADTNGTGKGLLVESTNTNSTSNAMQVTVDGKGSAAFFQATNTSNTSTAVAIEHQGRGVGLLSHTWGDGAAIQGYATFGGTAIEGLVDGGTGNAGKFTINTPTSSAATITATTNGTGVAGYFENTNTIFSRAGFNSAIHAKTAAASGWAGYFEGRGYFSTRLGIGTDTPGTALDVVGRVRTHELEITAGADLSESFDITDNNQNIIPGMVVSINAKRPGKLTVCANAYDRKVAGIVSGAGGVSTGMMMKHDGTLASGEHPVALTGRVYCLVDASRGAIEPGDMLTTSDTPGHAMKVNEYDRAQGAIIGKAMTPLKDGRGLVLVLVNLQ